MSTWVPFVDFLVLIGDDGLLHAAKPPMMKAPIGPTNAECGTPGKFHGTQTVDHDGTLTGDTMVTVWPPYARTIDGDRCRTCWVDTGKKPPAKARDINGDPIPKRVTT